MVKAIIEKRLTELGWTKVTLAKRLGKTRQDFHSWLNRKDFYLGELKELSIVLGEDLFAYFLLENQQRMKKEEKIINPLDELTKCREQMQSVLTEARIIKENNLLLKENNELLKKELKRLTTIKK